MGIKVLCPQLTTIFCIRAPNHFSNDKWLITSTRKFYKDSSASLDYIRIGELCSPIDSTVAIVIIKTSCHRIKFKH